jgi:purine-nucleoside phosphorylase
MWERIQEKQLVILEERKIDFAPECSVYIGFPGLGSLDEMKVEYTLPYQQKSKFPVSTITRTQRHIGFGTTRIKKVVAMQGRFHFMKGYSMTESYFSDCQVF